MTKKLLPAFLIATCFGCATRVSAATYQTPLFPTSLYDLHTITWITSGEAVGNISLEYQTKEKSSDPDSWQLLDSACNAKTNTLTCSAIAPTRTSSYLQFRLTYPDEQALQTFNLQLAAPTENPTSTDPELIYLSAFKTLDPELTATSLSWREQELTSPVADRIIAQVRATADGATWSAWQGNAATLTLSDLAPESTISAVPGGFDLIPALDTDYDLALVTYRDQDHFYSLTLPAASGVDESSAFANLSFTLNSLDGLHLGDELEISEVIGQDTFRLRGLISDLKPAENLVSVFAWTGAIPAQLPEDCAGATFCFPVTSQVHHYVTTSLPAPENTTSSPPFIIYADTSRSTPISYTPVITDLQFLRYQEPVCLEYTDITLEASASATPTCRTRALPLSEYYTSSTPQQLQYRLLYGFTGDVVVTDVFLHQDTPTSDASSSNLSGFLGRLRGGKTFTAGNSRPYYWN